MSKPKKLPPLILASGSPRRYALLQLLTEDFLVKVSSAEECDAEHYTPHEVCQLNAHRKAHVVAKHHPDALVIGADTEVALGSEIFGKPRNRKAAEEMLLRLQGMTHEVVTGVCLLQKRQHKERLFVVIYPGEISSFDPQTNPRLLGPDQSFRQGGGLRGPRAR